MEDRVKPSTAKVLEKIPFDFNATSWLALE